MTTSKHGCHNRKEFKAELDVPNGYAHPILTQHSRRVEDVLVGVRKYKTIPFVMSRECQHDKRSTDQRCDECKWNHT